MLNRITIRLSSKTGLALSEDSISSQTTGEVTHRYIQDAKHSRLGRLGRGIRRWTVKRTKPRRESQHMPHTPSPKKLTLSEETNPVDDAPSQTFENKTADETLLQDVTLTETTFQEDIEISVSIIQKEVRPTRTDFESAIPLEDTVKEISTGEVVPKDLAPCEAVADVTCKQDVQQETSPIEKEGVREPTDTTSLPLQTGYSSLIWAEVFSPDEVVEEKTVVSKQNIGHARTFVKSILNDKWVFWTDASLRPTTYPEGTCHHHGGIAVAHRLEDKQWNVQSAHVADLAGIDRLETLAILLALQWARQDREAELRSTQDGTGERPVFKICSDSMAALLWLKKAISLGIAVRKAAQKIMATADDTDDLGGLLTLSTVLNRCDPVRFSDHNCPERTFTSAIGKRTLEEYYKLCKLGSVEFHWVPAHRGLIGNEIADKEAGIASQTRRPRWAKESV